MGIERVTGRPRDGLRSAARAGVQASLQHHRSASTWCWSASAGGATDRQRMRGAILAGGGATRFGGRPKGLEIVGGERILDRLVEVLTAALGEPPLLVANAPEAPAWRPDLRVVSDVRPGLGALGGIYTAVVEAPAPVVCVAWDMPFVSAALIRALAAGLDTARRRTPGQRRAARRGAALCRLWPRLPAPPSPAASTQGDLRAIGFHARIRVGILPLVRGRALRRPGAAVLQREHRGRPRARGRSCGGDAHHLHHRAEERRKDHADRRARERAGAPRTPGHDDQARRPPGRRGPPGTDSWRHFHEGRAERRCWCAPSSACSSSARRRLRSRRTGAPHLSGADIVLVEGFKRAPLPKIEVFRRAVATEPIYDPAAPNAAEWVAIVTDDPELRARLPGAPLQRHHVAPAAGRLAHGAGPGPRRRDRARSRAAEAARADPRRGPAPARAAHAARRRPRQRARRGRRQPARHPGLDQLRHGRLRRTRRGRPRRQRAERRSGSAWSSSCPPAASPPARIGPGECARIFTGAPLPEGADSVIRQEDTDEGAGVVTIVQRPRRRREHPAAPARTSGRAPTVLRPAPRWARRSSACSPRSRWRTRWCTAGRGSRSWAAATRSWMWTSPRRS